jgi:ribosomal protein S18 acetylase RimI-like enzyme
MNFTLTPISRLEPAALDELAALHISSMHTLLSELGLPVVRHYYEVCQRDDAVIGICACSQPGPDTGGAKLLGWAVGSPYPDEINTRTQRPLPWFAGRMLRLAVTHPAVFPQLAASALASSAPVEPGAVELTYIGVAAAARGQGLGKSLLAAFVDAARDAGYSGVVLSVETDNPAAIALYTKAGFKIMRTFTEGRFERHRMQLAL